MAQGPNQRPSNLDIINNVLAEADPAKRIAKLKEYIKNDALDDLNGLAREVNAHGVLKTTAEKLQEFKGTLKEKAETLLQTMQIDQRLDALQNKLDDLIELLPELAPAQSPVQKVTNAIVKKVTSIAGGLSSAGTWVGETASAAFQWITDSENQRWLARTVKNFALRGIYKTLASPSRLGVQPGFPGLGQMASFGNEKLKQMDAVDSVWSVVYAEREVPPQNTIKFDGEFSKAVWLRLPEDQRTPDKIREMTNYFIDERRKEKNPDGTMKFGVPDSPIVVKMKLLMDPEQAKQLAKKKEEERKQKEREQLAKDLKAKWGVESVSFGDATHAEKANNWSVTVKEGDIDTAAKKAKANSEAAKLLAALPRLSNVSAVKMGSNETRINTNNGKVEVELSDTTGNVGAINTLANVLPNGGDHIASISIVRNVTLNNRIAWNPQNGVGNVECTDGMLPNLNAHFTELKQTVTNDTPTQKTFYEWKNNSWEVVT